ncbi:MAG: radical SAM protein [Oscillospiraceae bacterium]
MAFNFKMPYEKKVLPQRELGIYIHIPFCRSKCQYCDFYSLGGSREKAVTDRYLQALTSHFKEAGARAAGYVADTVYFGGGTPSFFGAAGLIRIFNELQRRFEISPDAEITFEANPDSVSPALLQALHNEGFNRISLGVQNDEDEVLKSWAARIPTPRPSTLWSRPGPQGLKISPST